MSERSARSKIVTSISLAAFGVVACDAFAPSRQPHTGSVDANSLRRDSLLSRNAFFSGLFDAAEEKTGSAGVFNVFSSSNSNDLIEIAKDIVDYKSGFYSALDPDVYAEDFVFRGPIVGPLNKKDYIGTMESFGIWKAFPDIKANSWGYSIDPEDPNRVWFMVRNTGTFDGEPLAQGVLNVQPTGAKLQGCPETFSVVFDEENKVKYLTVGYVADRFDGNTGGDGAAVGIFNIVGVPFPKPSPLLQALQWFSSEILGTYPLSYSRLKDVPEWFLEEKGKEKSCEGSY